MAEANTLKLYRNSDLNGNPIPLDILLSKGCIMQDFTGSPEDGIVLPTDTELLLFHGDETEGCLVQLDAGAAVPANGAFVAGLHYIPPGCIKVIDANGAVDFGVISATGNAGTLFVECVYAYKDARKSKQISRI